MAKRTCPVCYEIIPESAHGRRIYCSKPCGRAAHRDKVGSVCSETDCDRPVRAREVCNMHYKRLLRAEGRMNDINWNPRRKAAHAARRALTRGAPDAEKFDYREIYDRDGWICGICSKPVDVAVPWPDPMSVSLDHVLPVSRGGSHTRENVQCSHLACNLRKSNRTTEQQREAVA